MIHGLLFHEVGHLKKNHLLELYIGTFFCCLVYFVSFKLLLPFINLSSIPGLYVGLNGGFLGVLLIVIPGLMQRKMEYEADKFAADHIGADKYISVLQKLDDLTEGGVSRGGINYPTLKQRINFINANCK
jgi:Zn-dependent protease with chaperone function